MASICEHEPTSTKHSSQCKEIDYAVQPVDSKSTMPVDGPIEEVNDVSEAGASPSQPAGSASGPDTSGVSEQPPLNSPFRSPKLSAEDGMSDTALESGEIREHLLEALAVTEIAVGGGDEKVGKVEDVELDSNSASAQLKHEADDSNDKASATDNDEVTIKHEASDDGSKDVVQAEIVGGDVNPETQSRVAHEATDPISSTNNIATNTSATEDNTDITATQSQSARSVPPHLRSDLHPFTRQASVQSPRNLTAAPEVSRYADIPRAPRTPYTHNANHTYRSDGNPPELARASAQLMKTRNELEAERRKSAGLRKNVEEEIQKGMDKALAGMTTDLLNKQFELLAHQAKVQAKERELQYREDRIEQLEVFLSEGQKYAYRLSNEEEDGLTIAEVIDEHDRRQAELTACKEFADREHKLAMHLQTVHFREAALQMREQQYKAIMRSSFEAEMREKNMPDMDAKLNQVADAEYNRGFGAGKVAGRAEAEDEAHQKGFLEGYQACHVTQVALSNFRHGRLARDSSELDFLYNAAHPHNLFTMGVKIGGLKLDKEKKPMVNGVRDKQIPLEKKPVLKQQKAEEPVRKLPPPRLTFASELRGAQTMHNGHVVLANGSATPSPTPTPKSNTANGSNVAGERVYEGRQIVQYEEVEESNLIDLL